MGKLPNFFIVGAAKSGTTSLFHYLNQHPDIFIPGRKECRFLSEMPVNFKGTGDEKVNESIINTLDEYKSLFPESKSARCLGDVSPDYLYYYENTVKNLKKHFSNPKIIIILRNPVDRAFSQYSSFYRDKRELLTFEEALNHEQERIELNWEWAWRYKDVGLYYKQVKSYIDNFGSSTKIFLYDDLISKPEEFFKEIFKFLEVDQNFIPSTEKKFNVSYIPKNYFLDKILKKANPLKRTLRPVLLSILGNDNTGDLCNFIKKINSKNLEFKPETRKKLIDFFHDAIMRLQNLIKHDLSAWMQ